MNEECGVYIRRKEEGEERYDMLDEFYIKLESDPSYMVDNIVNGLESEINKSKILFKDGGDEAYIERAIKIINKMEDNQIYFEGVYVNISSFNVYLLFDSQIYERNCLIKWGKYDEYEDVRDNLDDNNIEENHKFDYFKDIKKEIVSNLNHKEIAYLIENAENFFSNELKLAESVTPRHRNLFIPEMYGNIEVDAKETVLYKVTSCGSSGENYYLYINSIKNTIMSELKRISFMVD